VTNYGNMIENYEWNDIPYRKDIDYISEVVHNDIWYQSGGALQEFVQWNG